jgi:hypothetical protein
VSGYYAGSAVVQATVKRQCQEKCMTPEKKAYRMCLDKTSTWDQVKACNKL